MPEELDVSLIESATYAEFLDSLSGRERDAAQLELVRTGKHQMLDEILAKRHAIETARHLDSGLGVGLRIVGSGSK